MSSRQNLVQIDIKNHVNDLIWNLSNGLMITSDEKKGHSSILLDVYFEHDSSLLNLAL